MNQDNGVLLLLLALLPLEDADACVGVLSAANSLTKQTEELLARVASAASRVLGGGACVLELFLIFDFLNNTQKPQLPVALNALVICSLNDNKAC